MEDVMLLGQQHQDLILSRLSIEDDRDFWAAALVVLLHDAEAELDDASSRREAYIQVGACSHWLRPHQTRWTAGGGFAWPSGYGSFGYSRSGLPEFDWFVLLRRDFDSQRWQLVEKFAGKRRFIFRAALPTRTKRHLQAAVHTLWLPSFPSNEKQTTPRFYGFRKIDDAWQCVASS